MTEMLQKKIKNAFKNMQLNIHYKIYIDIQIYTIIKISK